MQSSRCGTADPASNQEVLGSIPGLAQWVTDPVLWWAVVQVTDAALILVAAAQASSYNSDSTPTLGPSICTGGARKKKKKKKKKDTCTPKFIAALFIIAKIWKQLKCPSRVQPLKIVNHYFVHL